MPEEDRNVAEVWSRFEDFQHVFLATVDGDQPRVRPVTLIRFDDKHWVTTDTWSEKVKQIQQNPKIEISFVFKEEDRDCCIRISGIAKIVNDKKIKTRLTKHCDFFNEHWEDVDDPDFTLLAILPTEATYVTPEKTSHVRL